MNFAGFTSRSDVQDTDQLTGYRAASAGGEGRWTWAVLKAAMTTALSSIFATKASPALTGTPTAPTAAEGTETTQIATCEFVATAVAGLAAGNGLTKVTMPANSASSGQLGQIASDGNTLAVYVGVTGGPNWVFIPIFQVE